MLSCGWAACCLLWCSAQHHLAGFALSFCRRRSTLPHRLLNAQQEWSFNKIEMNSSMILCTFLWSFSPGRLAYLQILSTQILCLHLFSVLCGCESERTRDAPWTCHLMERIFHICYIFLKWSQLKEFITALSKNPISWLNTAVNLVTVVQHPSLIGNPKWQS